jgi:ParB family chromosome partitioning protein
MVQMALVENIQRSDLNAMEKARAYRRLCDEFSLSPEDVGRRVGEDRTTVTNYLRLLELPGEIAAMVSGGDISMGHARCLLAVDIADRQMQLARSVVKNQLSVRALEEVVRRARTDRGGPAASGAAKEKSAHVADVEGRFQRALGLKVRIQERRGKGRGRIIIDYNSLDEFDRVAAALGVQWE